MVVVVVAAAVVVVVVVVIVVVVVVVIIITAILLTPSLPPLLPTHDVVIYPSIHLYTPLGTLLPSIIFVHL